MLVFRGVPTLTGMLLQVDLDHDSRTPLGSTHFLSTTLCSQWDGRFAGGKKMVRKYTCFFFHRLRHAACLIQPFFDFVWNLLGGCTWLLLFHVSFMEGLGTLQNLCWFFHVGKLGIEFQHLRSSRSWCKKVQLPSIFLGYLWVYPLFFGGSFPKTLQVGRPQLPWRLGFLRVFSKVSRLILS